jgi:hypothetical protein
MRLLVSGATPTIRRLLDDPHYRAAANKYLGHLIVPEAQNRREAIEATGLPWACDNGCFGRFNRRAFEAMLRDFGDMAEWIVMPDIVCNAHGTLTLWYGYLGVYEDGEGTTPWALVAQNGMMDCDWEFFLGQCDALFIGGDDAYKEGREAAALALLARRRGKKVHMGRVNSFRRFQIAHRMGCDTVDGTGFSKFPDTNIVKALDWLERLDREPPGSFSPDGSFGDRDY